MWAIAHLEELRETHGWGELLFPSAHVFKESNEREPHLNQALRGRMGSGQEEVTAHGFRSTFSTFANRADL